MWRLTPPTYLTQWWSIGGCSPSLGLALPPCAPSQPAAVQNCSGQFRHCVGRMPKRTSAEPMARRAQGRMPGVNRVGSSIHPICQIRKTPQEGRFAYLAERVGFDPTLRHNRKPDFESGVFDHSATSPEICRRHGASRSPAHCSPRPWGSPFALRAQGQLRCPRSFQTNGSTTLPPLQKCPPRPHETRDRRIHCAASASGARMIRRYGL